VNVVDQKYGVPDAVVGVNDVIVWEELPGESVTVIVPETGWSVVPLTVKLPGPAVQEAVRVGCVSLHLLPF
jgi:hypothetical protein